jgi:hypothetical protein
MKRKVCLGDIGTDGRIILNLILQKKDMRIWSELNLPLQSSHQQIKNAVQYTSNSPHPPVILGI